MKMAGPATAAPDLDQQQRLRRLRELLRTKMLDWPVASPRQQVQEIDVDRALDLIREVVDGLDGDCEQTRIDLEKWRAAGEPSGAAGTILLPGAVAQLEQRKTLLAELLSGLARLQADYAFDDKRDELFDNLAALDAIAAGKIPEED
jgi:hypothetical protein